jgi:hypothetical protein
MFQPYIDRLTAFVSAPEFEPALIEAKKTYFRKTGEVFEDDDAFEMRMSCFFDWFLFDCKLPNLSTTPAELFVERHEKDLSEEERVQYRNLAHTQHGLFQVGKLKPEIVYLKDLFSGKTVPVYERRKPFGVESGDILEARLFRTPDDKLMFSPAFVFHPRDARRRILKMVKVHKKAGLPDEDLMQKLAYLRLKLDRYKHVRAEAIYEAE